MPDFFYKFWHKARVGRSWYLDILKITGLGTLNSRYPCFEKQYISGGLFGLVAHHLPEKSFFLWTSPLIPRFSSLSNKKVLFPQSNAFAGSSQQHAHHSVHQGRTNKAWHRGCFLAQSVPNSTPWSGFSTPWISPQGVIKFFGALRHDYLAPSEPR